MSLLKATQSQPLVIITGPNRRLKLGGWNAAFMLALHRLSSHYLHPGLIRPEKSIHGIIIGGGNDIDPKHYGALGDAGAEYDPRRDALEMHMIELGLTFNIPMLGICRGAQLINVVHGGNLHQDIRPLRNKTPNKNSLLPIKKAFLEPLSRLRDILQQDQVLINSLHNQAVNTLGSGLSVAAKDADGFIQAIECPHKDFLVGVQWHPEYMPYSSSQRHLFAVFSAAVRRYRDEHPD
jgi:putative glutamine amidotransferase